MSYYENVYYCSKCSFMQVETPYTHAITIPCPKCGNNHFTSTEPNSLELQQFHAEQQVMKEEYDNDQ